MHTQLMQKDLAILLTNTRTPTDRDISFWQRRGYKFIYYQSLLDVEFLHVKSLGVAPQAIVLTSSNAAKVLEKSDWDRTTPVYTVGKSTKFFAKSAEFTTCFTPSNTLYPSATQLIDWLRNNLQPKDGPIVFGCGNTIRHDVAEILADHGFETIKITLYNTKPTLTFDEKIKPLLKNNMISAVVLNSEQALLAFVHLCKINDIAFDNLEIIVPSRFIKEKAQELGLQKIVIQRRDYL